VAYVVRTANCQVPEPSMVLHYSTIKACYNILQKSTVLAGDVHVNQVRMHSTSVCAKASYANV
jgi:hypothetical protein